jgi:hypothetical protein
MTLPYIFNVAVVLGACLAFYKLVLRGETFYGINRFLLIACLALSFALPLLKVPQQFSLRSVNSESSHDSYRDVNKQQRDKEQTSNSEQSSVGNSQPVSANQQNARDKSQQATSHEARTTSEATSSKQVPVDHSPLTIDRLMKWLLLLYWFGVIVFGTSFLFQIGLLLWRAYRNPVIVDGRYRIIEVKGDKAPCSFGNNIFINPEKYDWETYNQILLHEKVHIEQRHTIDIVIAELVLIFQWFNPFAWIYRREIESNLEFLTDDQLMQHNKVEKKSYQLSLMKVSAPHFPLSLTTNYNQSILKKRIAMMNSKRSNLHTAWKYFFLIPVLAFLTCLLNEPIASGQDVKKAKSETSNVKRETDNHGMQTEGYWFAIIKDDRVNFRFSDEKLENDDFSSHHSHGGDNFKLSELGTLPRGAQGTFSITREAGKMDLTGKFEGNTGMGTYKFIADKAYVDYMNKELKENLDEDDQMAFFFINIKKDYLSMLKGEGYTDITKEDLIPVAALGIDKAYISGIKNSGFKDVSLKNLIPLKALGVDQKYISEIRSEYKDVTTEQLVGFKAQGIDKEYISKVRQMNGKNGKDGDDAEAIVSYKAMNITPEFVNSFKAVGMTNLSHQDLVSMKATGVTPEYVKSWYALGFKDLSAENFVGMKTQNVTPEYMKSFTALGFENIKPETLVAFKALGITPEWVKSFQVAGYKITDPDELTGLKAQNVTPEFIKSFEALGFKNLELGEMVAVKTIGVTPEYIKEMRAKGFNYNSLEKYVRLKTIE